MYNRISDQRVWCFRQAALLLFDTKNSIIIIILKIPVSNLDRIPRQTDTPFTVNVINLKLDPVLTPVDREIKNHDIIVFHLTQPLHSMALQRISVFKVKPVINPGSGDQLIHNHVIPRYQGGTHRIRRNCELIHHVNTHRDNNSDHHPDSNKGVHHP